jgi:hypothetical protein
LVQFIAFVIKHRQDLPLPGMGGTKINLQKILF